MSGFGGLTTRRNKGAGLMQNSIDGRGGAAWSFLAQRLAKSSKTFGDVLGYWDSLRVGNALPARSDLDPRMIQSALVNAFILDRARPGAVRIRVAGGHMNALMGMEVRGMPIRAYFDLLERRRLMELVETVFTAPALLELDLASNNRSGPTLEGKMLILPMHDTAGEVTKALGCLVTHGDIGTAPRRFHIRRDAVTKLAVPPAAKRTPAMAGFDEAATPFEARPAAKPVDDDKTSRQIPAELEAASKPGPVPWLRIVR